MINRRRFMKVLGGAVIAGASLTGYAFGYVPRFALNVTTYRFVPPGWTPGLKLRIVLISDLHACEPWMPVSRIDAIVARANALSPDIVLLTGDYVAGVGRRFRTGVIASPAWAAALAGLRAPLGLYAVLGNHDWWEDRAAQRRGAGPTVAGEALEAAGIPVLHNGARRIETPRGGLWIAGLGDQLALLGRNGGSGWRGLDDLDRTLAAVTTDEPILLLAHEPDIFPRVPSRVSLTLSGHTHGGQIRLFGWAPMVPSRFGARFAYGHVVEYGRHLVVSGGLGCSIAPVRLGVDPEIVLLELGEEATS